MSVQKLDDKEVEQLLRSGRHLRFLEYCGW